VSLVCGAVACPHRPLRTPIEKRLLGRTGAVAADMESVAVVDIAARAGVPWLVVRAVADSVAVPLPASVVDAIDWTGRLRWGRFGARLARHPLEIVQLAGLARGFWLALRTLRVVAERAGSVLVLPPAGRGGTEA